MGHGGRGSNALLSCRRKAWLGRQDSNLGSRDQNPLPYRLATPHAGRLLPRAAAARKRAAAPSSTRPIDPVCLSLRAGIFSAARRRAHASPEGPEGRTPKKHRCRTSGSDGWTRADHRGENRRCARPLAFTPTAVGNSGPPVRSAKRAMWHLAYPICTTGGRFLFSLWSSGKGLKYSSSNAFRCSSVSVSPAM